MSVSAFMLACDVTLQQTFVNFRQYNFNFTIICRNYKVTIIAYHS